MRVAVRKWGNSLALRIPKSVASDSRIDQGSLVEVSVEKGAMIVKPVTAQKYSLKQLLSRIKQSNLHRETRTGAAVGRESW